MEKATLRYFLITNICSYFHFASDALLIRKLSIFKVCTESAFNYYEQTPHVFNVFPGDFNQKTMSGFQDYIEYRPGRLYTHYLTRWF